MGQRGLLASSLRRKVREVSRVVETTPLESREVRDEAAIRKGKAPVSVLPGLRAFFHREQQLAAQRHELAGLREELAKQKLKNERMREGMRRCVTCEYRQESIGRSAHKKP